MMVTFFAVWDLPKSCQSFNQWVKNVLMGWDKFVSDMTQLVVNKEVILSWSKADRLKLTILWLLLNVKPVLYLSLGPHSTTPFSTILNYKLKIIFIMY